jgi:hypothetical protein
MSRLLKDVTKKPASSTQKLLRISVVVLLVSSLVLTGWIAVARARQTEATVKAIVRQQAELADIRFRLFFLPVMTQLSVIRELGQEGILDSSQPEDFKRALAALVKPLDQVGTLVVAGEDEPFPLSYRGAEWEPLDLDEVRASPWYEGALQSVQDGSIYWADPRSLSTSKEPGLVAAIAWQSPGNSTHPTVLSLNIKRSQLERFVQALPNRDSGDLLLLSELDRVVRFSTAIDDRVEMTTREQFFRTAEHSAGSTLTDFLRQLDKLDVAPEPFRFTLKGSPWWIAFEHITLGQRTIWIGVDAPESTLLAGVRRTEHILIYTLVGILVLGMVSVIFLARSYGKQLQKMSEKPKYAGASERELSELVHRGEQERLEFKSTLRWNLKAGKPGDEISRAWMKTLVAFMNTNGGTLIVGVEDNGQILGIEADKFPNQDKYLLHFNNLIKQHVGLEYAGQLTAAIRSVEGKRILVVDCERSPKPVFLKHGDDEEFFVRIGSGTRKLPLSKVLEYIGARAAAS